MTKPGKIVALPGSRLMASSVLRAADIQELVRETQRTSTAGGQVSMVWSDSETPPATTISTRISAASSLGNNRDDRWQVAGGKSALCTPWQRGPCRQG